MAQQLRAVTCEDPGSVPIGHIEQLTTTCNSIQGIKHPILAVYAHVSHTDKQAYTLIQANKDTLIFFNSSITKSSPITF